MSINPKNLGELPPKATEQPPRRTNLIQAIIDLPTNLITLKKITDILEKEPDTINTPDSEGFSPLHHAAKLGLVDVTSELLNSAGILVDGVSETQASPLSIALSIFLDSDQSEEFDKRDNYLSVCWQLIIKDANIYRSSGTTHTSPFVRVTQHHSNPFKSLFIAMNAAPNKPLLFYATVLQDLRLKDTLLKLTKKTDSIPTSNLTTKEIELLPWIKLQPNTPVLFHVIDLNNPELFQQLCDMGVDVLKPNKITTKVNTSGFFKKKESSVEVEQNLLDRALLSKNARIILSLLEVLWKSEEGQKLLISRKTDLIEFITNELKEAITQSDLKKFKTILSLKLPFSLTTLTDKEGKTPFDWLLDNSEQFIYYALAHNLNPSRKETFNLLKHHKSLANLSPSLKQIERDPALPALYHAITTNNLALCQELLGQGANPNQIIDAPSGCRVHFKTAEGLLQMQQPENISLFQYAIVQGHEKIIALLEKKADLTIKDDKGYSAKYYLEHLKQVKLNLLIIDENDTEALELIKKENTDINETDAHGMTPLHRAIQKPSIALVTALLKKPTIDFDKATGVGSPLYFALSRLDENYASDLRQRETLQIIYLLIAKGAKLFGEINAQNDQTQSDTTNRETIIFRKIKIKFEGPPRNRKIDLIPEEMAKLKNFHEFTKLVDLQRKMPDKPLLYYAIVTQNVLLCKALVETGANVNEAIELAPSKPGFYVFGNTEKAIITTLLHLAIYFGSSEIIELLVRNGADIEASDSNNTSIEKHLKENIPLHLSLSFINLQALKMEHDKKVKLNKRLYSTKEGSNNNLHQAPPIITTVSADTLSNPVTVVTTPPTKTSLFSPAPLSENSQKESSKSEVEPVREITKKTKNKKTNVLHELLKDSKKLDQLSDTLATLKKSYTPTHVEVDQEHKTLLFETKSHQYTFKVPLTFDTTTPKNIFLRAHLEDVDNENNNSLDMAIQTEEFFVVMNLTSCDITITKKHFESAFKIYTKKNMSAIFLHLFDKVSTKTPILKSLDGNGPAVIHYLTSEMITYLKKIRPPVVVHSSTADTANTMTTITKQLEITPVKSNNNTDEPPFLKEAPKEDKTIVTDIDEFKSLLRKSKGVMEKDDTEKNEKEIIASMDNYRIAQFLRNNPTYIEEGDETTPLHQALHRPNLVKELLERSVIPQAVGKLNQTPLHLAIILGWNESSEILINYYLKNNINHLNVEDSTHKTPLDYAISTENQAVILLFTKNNNLMNIILPEALTTLRLIHYYHNTSNPCFELESVMKRFDPNLTCLNNTNKYGSMLHIAVRIANKGMVKYLLSQAIDVTLMDENKKSALMVAITQKFEHAISLIDKGLFAAVKDPSESFASYLNQQDDQGNTALHYAIIAEDIELCEILMDKGANPFLPNKENKTALTLAEDKGKDLFIELAKTMRLLSGDNTNNNSVSIKKSH